MVFFPIKVEAADVLNFATIWTCWIVVEFDGQNRLSK